MHNTVMAYILVSFAVVAMLRILPLTLIRRPITNPFVCSFFYYVPYATLAVMTFPAIIQATAVPIAGAAALIVGVILAWNNKGLPMVASACCITVLITEAIIL